MLVFLGHTLRLRRVRWALRQGNLEEAARLLVHAGARNRRACVALAGELAQALAERARMHLRCGNLRQAWIDAKRAVHFGGAKPQLVALRNEIARLLRSKRGPARKERPPKGSYLLWLEAVGTYLLLTAGRIRLGRQGSSLRPHVPLAGHVPGKAAELLRCKEKYVLSAHWEGVTVNGTYRGKKVLCEGDLIGCGRRNRFRFSMPCPLNGTALLRCEAENLLPGKARYVVLVDRFVLAGAAGYAHITIPSARGVLALFHRKGRFFLSAGADIFSSEAQSLERAPLALGCRTSAGGVTLTVTESDL